jgi:hypothetical protein
LIPHTASTSTVACLSLLLVAFLSFPWPGHALAGPYFADGYLGLTQTELRAKLGPPNSVRDRKAALRVFNYYSLHDWENYYKKLVSPQNGEDVYNYKRNGIDVRYSFGYVPDQNDTSDFPTLYVNLVDIEFGKPVPIEQIPALVPEFQPPTDAVAPAFRSNLWVLIFKGQPSGEARFIIREQGKERPKHPVGQAAPAPHTRSHSESLLPGIRPAAGSPAAPDQEDSAAQVRGVA